MDHSHMDHGHMDHGHMDHDMPGMGGDGPQCNMNMLFTWDTTNLCIVFRGWRIDGMGTLIFSLLAIVLLTAGYEAVREISRRYEAYEKRVLEGRRGADDLRGKRAGLPFSPFLSHTSWDRELNASNVEDVTPNESSSLLASGRDAGRTTEQQMKIVKAILYAVQVFYSFFIMLLFMTYNGWVMLAVAVGAFVGYLMFSGSSATKTVACH